MNFQQLKEALIEGFSELLRNEKGETTISVEDQTNHEPEYIWVTIFERRPDPREETPSARFSICIRPSDNAAAKGKARTIQRFKIKVSDAESLPMAALLQKGQIGSNDMDVNPQTPIFEIELDPEDDLLW